MVHNQLGVSGEMHVLSGQGHANESALLNALNLDVANGNGVVNGSAESAASIKHEQPHTAGTPSSEGATGTSQAQPHHYSAEYLSQLLKDKKQLAAFPNVFSTFEHLVDSEINKVRVSLFQFEFNKDELALPEADGVVTVQQKKVFVPVKDFPDYNFVGRILGPRGMTAKQLEQETGCKIMVRGRGSMRDKKKEDMNRGKPNWEHLDDELHVLIQCEDTENRANVKLQRAEAEVRRLLVPAAEGEDELKRKQLMELAIINGTYRPANQQKIPMQTPRLLQPMGMGMQHGSPLRSPLGLNGPMILSPTRTQPMQGVAANHLANLTNAMLNAQAAQFPMQATSSPSAITNNDQFAAFFGSQMMDPTMSALAQYGYGNGFPNQTLFAATQQQHSTPTGHDQQQFAVGGQEMSLAGAIMTQRRLLGQLGQHPYQRP